MATVRLSSQAERELSAVLDYYDLIGASGFAEVFEAKLIEKLRRLEQFPRLGRIVPEIRDESIREVLHRNYRIVYMLDRDEEEVLVLTIFHSAQQFGGLSPEDG